MPNSFKAINHWRISCQDSREEALPLRIDRRRLWGHFRKESWFFMFTQRSSLRNTYYYHHLIIFYVIIRKKPLWDDVKFEIYIKKICFELYILYSSKHFILAGYMMAKYNAVKMQWQLFIFLNKILHEVLKYMVF